MCHHQLPSRIYMVCHSVVLFCVAVCVVIPGCLMLVFMLIQYTDSLVRRCVFSMPMWLLCNCSRIYLCKNKVYLVLALHCNVIDHGEFMSYCSVFSIPGSTASLVCGHPLIIYLLHICNSAPSSVAAFRSSIDVHMGMCTVVLMVCILLFIPDFSWSSTWLWCDSQSTIYNSGPGLYKRNTLYWCIHSMMCCNHFDNVTTSSLSWP